MPECPIEAEKAWGAKSAKRPCYWDEASQKVIPVSWKEFQTSRPTPEHLRAWFASNKTQVGCLGGWNGKHWLAWIDFDLHHFESQDALDAKLAWWALKYPILGEAPKFRSPSGGYRYLIAFEHKPDKFGGNSGFCFTPGDKERLGELLTNNGGHTLLPPTQSYNGAYQWERWSKYPPVVETPEAIGLYPVGKKTPEPRTITPRPVNRGYVPGAVALDQVLCPSAAKILQLGAKKGKRSDAIATLANEIYGWINWLNTNNISFNGHPYDLIQYAWNLMEDADKDPDKWRRIITKIESDPTLRPAAHPRRGDEACWKKVHKLAKITNFRNTPTPIGTPGTVTIIPPAITPTKKDSGGNPPPPGDNDGSGGDGGENAGEEKQFTQIVLEQLYTDTPWISCGGTLYRWTGTYYKRTSEAEHYHRITHFANKFVVLVGKKGKKTYPYATPYHTQQALKWVKNFYIIDADDLNPSGINCTNGVLQIEWDAPNAISVPVPTPRLVPHSPTQYFTYEPLAEYDPNANSDACQTLLNALTAPQQDIFLKTIAASLDLPTIRKCQSRGVRTLILTGDGQNGKDTLREVVSMMYGHHGVTGKTLSDFVAYDEGRKFPLAGLEHSRINWAPENSNIPRLDNVQALKQFITGEPLDCERKGQDAFSFKPKGIAIFNANGVLNLQGTQDAIKSRLSILAMEKQFKRNADPKKGEIEADPRFKDDPNFIKSEVLPSFLNRVLDALTRLLSEGIDYSSCEQALAETQTKNSHLFQFAADTGLGYVPGASVAAGEIWKRLEQWYQDNGTLTYEDLGYDRKKAIWVDQPRRSDANVRGVNQIVGRFLQLFPKAKRATRRTGPDNKQIIVLEGIDFFPEDPTGGGAEVTLPLKGSQLEVSWEVKNPDYTGNGSHGSQFSPPSAHKEKNQTPLTAKDNPLPQTLPPSLVEQNEKNPLESNKGVSVTSVTSNDAKSRVSAFPSGFPVTSGEAETDFRDEADDNLIESSELARHLLRCDTYADVKKLHALYSKAAIDAAKGVMKEEERLNFEAIASQCANLSPAAPEVAPVKAVTPPLNPNLKVDPLQRPDWETTRGKEVFGGFHVGDRIQHQDGRNGTVCDPESDSTPCVLNANDEAIWYEDLVPVWFDAYVIGYPVGWFVPDILRPVDA
jgi:phage/plasmid-associated DNA primase